jgi:hypothetical protein
VLAALCLIPASVVVVLWAATPALDRFRRRELRRILRDVCEVLNAHGVEYWCDYGTLLGLVRDGDLILGDKDADLCLVVDQKPRVMGAGPAFQQRGYRLTDRGGDSRRLLRVFDRRTPFYVDLYEYTRDGETLRSVLEVPLEDVPARLVASRRPLVFLGAPIPVPADAESHLVHRYGPDYRTPRRNDKGRSAPYSRWRSFGEDIQASWLFVWFWARRRFRRATAD